MESKKFPKKCRHCGSLKFERDAVGSLEWMNFRCGSSCDQRGEWSQSDECRITELEAIEAAKDARIASLTSEVDRLRAEVDALKAEMTNAQLHNAYEPRPVVLPNPELAYKAVMARSEQLKEPDHA